jgi:glycosyltransferase involved in cell wall biosynthesis
MISIIIPALNEEDYLPLLLESIKRQKVFEHEIILADAGSKDKTLEIAKQYGCIITPGGLPGRGRNLGAKVAKGEFILFLDADCVLPDDFFEKFLFEAKTRNLDIAGFCLVPSPKNKLSSFLLNVFYNQPIVLLESALPHAAMGIFVKKDIFEKAGGFDEDVKLAEDHYFVRRAIKLFKSKFGIIKSTEIFVSDRRFKTDGWFSTGIKFLLCELHMIFLGPVKSDIFKYKFDHHKKKKPN